MEGAQRSRRPRSSDAGDGSGGSAALRADIVKDNFETIGLQSAAGSLAIERIRVPARMHFWCGGSKRRARLSRQIQHGGMGVQPVETVSSILPGYTSNPYALDRVTAGSSGGTAAAVAASFGAVGLGTDTGNSIRGPSSHQALVGIRSTMGLTSRAGVVPLSLLADIAGPMARTVEDAVAVFQVIVGEDPDDPVTLRAEYHPTGPAALRAPKRNSRTIERPWCVTD